MTVFLLLHGACHGGWSWAPVTERLRSAGHRVVAPDLPCDDLDAGLERYVTVALQALDQVTAPGADDLVVAAHSLGSLTAPAIALRRPTRRLVFVAGIIGAPGRTLSELADLDADRDVPLTEDDFTSLPDGRFCFTPNGGRRALYHDCPENVAGAAVHRLRYQRSLWLEPAPYDAWPDTELVSVLCRDDRIVSPAWTRRVSRERLGVDPIELGGGHTPMLSRPDEVAAVLLGR